VLPDKLSYADNIGEASLDNPLPWDTIPGANYGRLDLVQPYLAALATRSDARITTNRDFIFIRQDIDEFRKLQADKTEPLNEQEQLKEIRQNQSSQKVYEAGRAITPVPDEKNYNITVENAGLPGLPAPETLTATNKNFVLIATNENGSVTIMTTNNETAVGVPLNPIGTNASDEVVTKTQPDDPTLNETEHILENYISLLSAHQTLIAK